MPNTSDVFGLSVKVNDYSYVDRDRLDRKLRRLLSRDTHVAIKGPSKCGKSWLRQKCMVGDAIVVQCRLGMSVEHIYSQALSELGVSFDTHTSSTTTYTGAVGGSGSVNVPFVAKAQIEASAGIEHERTTGMELDFSKSIQNLSFVASEINASKKRLIIEDFHYLDMPQREQLAHDLKTLWDYKCFVVIIGVWTESNLLTFMNPDLSGRLEELSVQWSDTDLKKVIKLGCGHLNIEISDQIQQNLISDSFGNVGILQSLLLNLIEDQANIEKTQSPKAKIEEQSYYSAAARAYAEKLDGIYQQFAQILSTGIRQRKDSTGIYALTMQAIVNATDSQLMNGFSRTDIFDITSAIESRIQKGNLKTVLGKLVELQQPESGRQLVISYDESIDAVFVVDLQLLFYRKHHTMKWPWEELAEEARQQSLVDENDE